MKNLAILLTVSLIAAAAAYFAFVSGGEIDEMTLIVDSGRAVVERGGERIRVEESQDLEEGDLITSDGVAHLRLAGGREAFLEGKARVSVTNDRVLDGQGGRVRALSTEGDLFRVTFGDVAASAANSNFRLDLGVGSTRVGTYGGVVGLTSAGQPDLRVPQYFEAAVAVGDLPDDVRPYRFDTSDFWDQQFLDDVITLDDELINTVNAISGQLRGAKPPLTYFGGLAGRNVDFMRRHLKRSAEDLLIGFTVAENAREVSLKRAFTRAFRLRDDGGRWGLVATILDAKAAKLVAGLQDLVIGTGVADGDGEAAETPTFAAGDSGPSDGGGGNDPSNRDPRDDDPTDPRDPNDPDEPDEPDDCTSGPECDGQDVQDRIDEILPGGDPSPTPDQDNPPLTDGVLGGGGDKPGGLP